MTMHRNTHAFFALAAGSLFASCGLERLLVEDTSGTAREIEIPLGSTYIRGQTGLTGTVSVDVTYGDGTPLERKKVVSAGATYEVQLVDAEYAGLLVTARSGAAVLMRVVPEVHSAKVVPAMDLTVDSATAALAAQAAVGPWNGTLAQQRGPAVTKIVAAYSSATAVGGALANLRAAVQRVFDAAKAGGTDPSLSAPALDTAYGTVRSAIDPLWLASVSVDLDGDGTPDSTSAPFDALLVEGVKAMKLCRDPEVLRTIFVVNFNAGQKDGNCSTINRFKWVKDEPGKQMFFTGGIHKDSTLQDPVIQAEMGNWSPNQVKMYDDGAHGDQQSGDNIWTVMFDLPRGLKTAYKYEWGKQGAGWTGSEEWPGNQRLLQVVDVNDDGFVYRYDNFGDEATNKDRVNGYFKGNGSLDWTTDANANGIPDADEQPVDLSNSCAPGEWITPTWIGPALSYCGQ